MRPLRSFLPLLILSALVPLAARAQSAPTPTPTPDAQAAVRAEFIEALDGVPRGLPEEDDSDALRAYVLYPYLQAERLLQRFNAAPDRAALDASVAAYLDANGDAPWTRALRAAWLRSLAERAQWSEFLRHYMEARADAGLRCERLNAQIATAPAPALVEAGLSVWRTGAELPSACARVFDWLRTQNALTPEQIALRARLALEGGKLAVARMVIAQLPEPARAPYQRWADVLEKPEANLVAAVTNGTEPRGIADAFAKLARSSHETAFAVLQRMERACPAPCGVLVPPASVGELRREIALNQAWSRLPESVDSFRAVPDAALDERGHEWRVRAALWNDEWKQAAEWLARMPAPLAAQPRWRYWRARVAEKLGQTEQATPLYETLVQENGTYALLAAERLDRGYVPRARSAPDDAAARAQIEAMPGMARAREAWTIQQPAWARAEWNEATGSFDAPLLIAAARVASGWGWHLMAVASATRAELFDDFELLYPRPYLDEVKTAARRARLPAQWIWGVLRQESLYDPRARSSADALGLLQLLPATARNTARRTGLPQPTRDDLFDPATNVLLGAAYLREQMDTFGGRFVLVLGAYNAGPNAVRRWLPAEPRDTDVWIENVPFNETRHYIQRIVWHSTVFAWLETRQPQRIGAWLTPISSDLTPLPQPAR